jgi:glucose/arabinose dehydrogenase
MRGIAIVLLCLFCGPGTVANAATVGTGFAADIYVDQLDAPTAMAFAPDGRLFICEQEGRLRIVENGELLATPFLTLQVDSRGERGLLGVTFDPDFETNRYVYVYYTALTPTVHNRVSRFKADGNTAVAGSESMLLDLEDLGTSLNHNGGALHFGNDGKLYIAVGDNQVNSNAQLLTNRLGKILRLGADGSIPEDNPHYTTATGANRAIWAHGLRNPFTVAVQPSTGRIFINDVGQNTWEEINEGIAGANYGWAATEGPTTDPRFVSPLYAYKHNGVVCAITGGAFYEPAVGGFPGEYAGDYFFGDYCSGVISRRDDATGTVTPFASDIASPVDIREGPDGALYVLSRGETASAVVRVRFVDELVPRITQQPSSVTLLPGQAHTFSVHATGASPLRYQWRRDGTPIAGETSSSYRFTNAQLTDSGASFDAVVSNEYGEETSASAVLTVTANTRPTASITKPSGGTTYAGGDVIQFAGTGSDAEDGTLPASNFTWWVNLHHDSHTHPHVQPFSGAKSGSFVIPVTGETSANVFYRLHLEVVDSGGLTRHLIRDIKPRTATVTLASSPAGLQLLLDGQPVTTPYSFLGVVGIRRSLEAVSPQTVAGTSLTFKSWSDGGARTHTITTPAVDTTLTAEFTSAGGQLSIGDASVLEGNSGSRNAVFTVTLSSPVATSVSVDWATSDGSATAGSDYLSRSGTSVFAAGVTSRTISVPVLGDTTPEPNETFSVRLSSPVGATIADSLGTGTIRSDDSIAMLRFGAATYRKNENGGSVVLTVLRKNSTAGAASVNFSTSAGSAVAGSDFQSTSGTLNFADGAASATLTIPLVGDFTIEPDETFNVLLSSPTGAVLGTPSTAVVTIANDDLPGAVSFSTTSYARSESGVSAKITVSRSGGLGANVSVGYRTTDGTATAGFDYSGVSGTLTFAGGVASQTFTVPITNDTIYEGNETVGLSLANPTNGATLGVRPNATLTIADDDSPGIIAFSTASYSRAETGGAATVVIRRSGGTASGISVNYATGGGTATAGADYTPGNGTVNFAAGQTSAQVAIPLVNDTAAEGNETFGIALSGPAGGATLGTTTSATVTILDDDD